MHGRAYWDGLCVARIARNAAGYGYPAREDPHPLLRAVFAFIGKRHSEHFGAVPRNGACVPCTALTLRDMRSFRRNFRKFFKFFWGMSMSGTFLFRLNSQKNQYPVL